MKPFEWNARSIATVAIALLLAASVGAMGLWLLLSGQPGTGMMESREHVQMMESADHAGLMAPGGPMATGDRPAPGHTMGVHADQGVLGGYTGAVGLVMIVLFTGMIGLLLYALFRERPGRPEPASCWNCQRPVESYWSHCAYCGSALAQGRAATGAAGVRALD